MIAFERTVGNGAGQIIAIVEAYDHSKGHSQIKASDRRESGTTDRRMSKQPWHGSSPWRQSVAVTTLDATLPCDISAPPDLGPAEPPTREVRHEYSPGFPSILAGLGASLVVSTYQAGKVVVVGAREGKLTLSFHNFEQAMGVAVRPGGIAVGARAQVWFLDGAPSLVPRLDPPGRHDACFLTRSSRYTGEIQGHELAWAGDDLWVVNTAFSCLCTLHHEHSFEPRWRPPFVSTLAPEDRCHLNGLAMADGKPRYVTVLAETDTRQGWRPVKATGGCLIDVPSGETVARGFAMPHSPRVHQGRVWVLHSGAGRLVVVDPATGRFDDVTELPGFTRGLAMVGPYAFIGLSKIRETSTFGGVPIAERRDELKCGVGAIDLRTGRLAAHLEFVTGVDEVFDVVALPGSLNPLLSGPYPALDGGQPIWTVPTPDPQSQSARG
jgi:uncharacterized protein (TIGR03032 family)